MNQTSDPLNRRSQQILERNKRTALKRQEGDRVRLARAQFVAASASYGGAIATLERIRKFGRTPDLDELELHQYVEDCILLMADWRIPAVYLTGGAQLGKSLISYLVAADLLIAGRLSFGWGYPSDSLRQNDQPKFRKIAEAWLEQSGETFDPDRNNLRRFELSGAIATFTHANSTTKKDGAAHGSDSVSYSASALFHEEYSQSRDSDLSGRLQAGKLPSHPQRFIGTPGSGSGIERSAEAAECTVYPCLQCECGAWNPLHPTLLYLAKVENQDSFFSGAGRPRKTRSQFTCIDCDRVLSGSKSDIRMRVFGRDILRIVQTGDRALAAKCESISVTQLRRQIVSGSVGIWLLPLINGVEDGEAWCARTTESLNTSRNIRAAIQELLGVSADVSQGLSVATISQILARQYHHPERSRLTYQRFFGLDQGVDCHFVTSLLRDEDGTVIIEFARRIQSDALQPLIDALEPTSVLVDGEPDKTWAVNLCNENPGIVRAANQSTSKKIGNRVVKSRSRTGGKTYEVWDFSNQYWIGATIDLLNSEEIGILADLDEQNGSDLDPSWSDHIRSIKRSPSGWVRPDSHEDDFFYSLLFAVVAMELNVQFFKAIIP
jgi:hypothetical protein